MKDLGVLDEHWEAYEVTDDVTHRYLWMWHGFNIRVIGVPKAEGRGPGRVLRLGLVLSEGSAAGGPAPEGVAAVSSGRAAGMAQAADWSDTAGTLASPGADVQPAAVHPRPLHRRGMPDGQLSWHPRVKEAEVPRTEIEIMGERITTVEERINVVVDVPQNILDEGDLHAWVEQQLEDGDTELSREVNNDINVTVEDETVGFEITQVDDFGPHD